jgi:hypothetical protein
VGKKKGVGLASVLALEGSSSVEVFTAFERGSTLEANREVRGDE